MNLLAAVDLLIAAHRRGEPGPEEAWTAVERFADADNRLRRLVEAHEAYRFEHEPPRVMATAAPRAKSPAGAAAIETAPLPGPRRNAPASTQSKAAETAAVQPVAAERE